MSIPTFKRRKNYDDGTFDSICTTCYQTVARQKKTEVELEEDEKAHVCNGIPPLIEFPTNEY
jgi:hypothetical protein